MDSPNILALKSASRDAQFAMDGEGSLWFRQWPILAAHKTHDKVVINIEAKLPALKGEIEFDCGPVIILSWLEAKFQFDELLHRTIETPRSYDEFVGEHVTSFYYFEHLDFDDVRIQFVEREGERYRIQVTGTAPDMGVESDSRMDIRIDTVVHRTDR